MLWFILALIVAFILVLLIRTLQFKPKDDVKLDESPVEIDKEASVSALAELIRCKTVSYDDHSLEDDAEFEKLFSLLPTLYPTVMKTAEQIDMGNRALLFRWKGKTEGDPAVLMAHFDVVPVVTEGWEKPAFEAIVENGEMWGRGTLDTKVTFNGILSAAENLIKQGFQPEHDIYFAFSGGEETNGPGAAKIVDYFEGIGVTPSLVVDEGGAVVNNVFPGVTVPAALIGLAEKGLMNLKYTVRSDGGHASAPKPHTPVGKLSMACAKVEAHPFDTKLCRPVLQMFDTLGRHSSFLYRLIFANLWCFSGLLGGLAKKSGGTMNALMRTTVAFTQMQGGAAPNVIPPEATMVSNIRINPEESVQYVIDRINRVIGDPDVKVEVMVSDEPSRVSTTDCEGWQKVACAAASTWKGALVAPYLMTQCSDSRNYGRISDRVYRFSAQDMTMEEVGRIHGNNERIRLEVIPRAVEFFYRLMKQC